MTQATCPRSVLWTAFLDYYATGEGRSIMAWIGYAADETECRRRFGETFHAFFASAAECVTGVCRNEITTLLWSGKALDSMQDAEHRGNVLAYSRLHFNLA